MAQCGIAKISIVVYRHELICKGIAKWRKAEYGAVKALRGIAGQGKAKKSKGIAKV